MAIASLGWTCCGDANDTYDGGDAAASVCFLGLAYLPTNDSMRDAVTGPTHVISGLAAAALIGRATPFTPDAVGLFALLAGSLAPDIDGNGVITKPGAVLRRFLGKTLAELFDLIASFFVALIHLFFRHRGLLHAPLLPAVLFLIGSLTNATWLSWFAVGYLTHLLGDVCTSAGIPALAPFSEKRLSLSSISVGSWAEAIVASVLLLFAILCGWTLLPEAVKETHLGLLELISGATK